MLKNWLLLVHITKNVLTRQHSAGVEIRKAKTKHLSTGIYHKDCFEEYKPCEKVVGQLSETEIRKPREKIAGTCPYHKDCFEEFKPVEKTEPRITATEVRSPVEKITGGSGRYHKQCFDEFQPKSQQERAKSSTALNRRGPSREMFDLACGLSHAQAAQSHLVAATKLGVLRRVHNHGAQIGVQRCEAHGIEEYT